MLFSAFTYKIQALVTHSLRLPRQDSTKGPKEPLFIEVPKVPKNSILIFIPINISILVLSD